MRAKLIAAAAVFLLALPYYWYLSDKADFPAHIGFARDMLSGKRMVPHPLFHGTLILLTAGNLDGAAEGASAFLMAISLAALTWLTWSLLEKESRSVVATFALSLALTVATSLPNWWGAHRYVGTLGPMQWHNPTGIFEMPFALAYFIAGLRLLANPCSRTASLAGMMGVLSLLAKPSYFLAFAPCLLLEGLSIIRSRGPRTALWLFAISFGPCLLILAGQYHWLTSDGRVLVAPLEGWRILSKNHIVGSALAGMAFPLAVLCCYARQVNGDRVLILAWLSSLVAAGTYACFLESARITDGNFAWGSVYASHVLFVASAGFLLRQAAGGWRTSLCWAVLAAHAISGAQFLLCGGI
jgi:hypothetical protein